MGLRVSVVADERQALNKRKTTVMTNESDKSKASSPLTEGTEPEPFIKKAEVARRLQKTVRTVDNLMKRGILPYYKIGRSVTFKWSEIASQLAQTCRVSFRSK